MNKISQLRKVAKHLISKKTINTWDAIQLYNITRLGALVHTLRHEYEWEVKGEWLPTSLTGSKRYVYTYEGGDLWEK